jgi:hypothetical protein
MSGDNCKFCGLDVTQFRWCQNQTCKLYNKRVPVVRGFAFGSALCKRCNGLLSSTNPCPECLRNEPDAILKRFEESDKEALRAELGYSSEVDWRVFNEDAGLSVGKEWEGYSLELLGVVFGRYTELSIPAEGVEFYERIGAIVRTPEGYAIVKPWLLLPFECIHDASDPDVIIKLCRIRAQYKDSSLYLEMRPQPYGVRRISICGLEHRHTKKDLDAAFEGLDLRRKAAKRLGRKKGSRTYSRTAFLSAAQIAYQRLFNLKGEHPTGLQLAVEMHLSKSAFFDHLRDYELTVEDIRATAMRL